MDVPCRQIVDRCLLIWHVSKLNFCRPLNQHCAQMHHAPVSAAAVVKRSRLAFREFDYIIQISHRQIIIRDEDI
ncbi:protein of unknown function (plasmid) [Cupriavidus taiwanensis]|uniref:Uncharacterized protein n=1 Tax=Cupriavidus taiwanensis TaxID=164546 RepID=A0A9Q7UZT3_9BURK|nr:protein of unknown function [Cupriavidus taiwanensis]